MRFGFTPCVPPIGADVIAWAVLSPLLLAQMGSWNVAEKDLGRPAQPPFITPLGMVYPDKMVTDPSLRPKGPVKEVLFEELRAETTTGGQAGEVIRALRSEYDEQGRVVKESDSGSITINRYDGSRLVSRESTFPEGKTKQPPAWNYWKYDEGGKLIEFRRGRGDTIQNHETNFTRDRQGRLTGFEYHQGAKDMLDERTEFRYSPDGKSIDTTYFDRAGEVYQTMAQTMDGEGRVIQAVIQERDWQTKKPKRPMRTAFNYDSKGRVVEQDTDPYDFNPEAAEQEVLPGKVVNAYDDVKHTRTSRYTGEQGSFVATVMYDANGAVIGFEFQGPGQMIEARLQCDDDSLGNWTRCEQIAKTAEVNKVTKKWRRTITYR